jgi:RNA polymerase-binding transcription factor DksA
MKAQIGGKMTAPPYLQGSTLASRKPNGTVVPTKWTWHYRTLCRLRNELMEHRCTLIQDSKETTRRPGREIADWATDEFNRDLLMAELSHNQDALYEVDAALRRIETGTYGICEESGQPIPAARLKAVPATRFTCDSERSLEKNGLAEHVHLGRLRSLREVKTR